MTEEERAELIGDIETDLWKTSSEKLVLIRGVLDL